MPTEGVEPDGEQHSTPTATIAVSDAVVPPALKFHAQSHIHLSSRAAASIPPLRFSRFMGPVEGRDIHLDLRQRSRWRLHGKNDGA